MKYAHINCVSYNAGVILQACVCMCGHWRKKGGEGGEGGIFVENAHHYTLGCQEKQVVTALISLVEPLATTFLISECIKKISESVIHYYNTVIMSRNSIL